MPPSLVDWIAFAMLPRMRPILQRRALERFGTPGEIAFRIPVEALMVGCNNEWALAESHVGRFLTLTGSRHLEVRSLIALNNLRVFKVLRYAWLKGVRREQSDFARGLEGTRYVWGGPELVRYPPEGWIFSFAGRTATRSSRRGGTTRAPSPTPPGRRVSP